LIVLDTSVLVDSLTGPKRTAPTLREVILHGERLLLSVLVLYEWLRGPRSREEIADQEELFPVESAIAYEVEDVVLSARLYQSLRRPRGREIDLAIAACAINREARLWTLNPADFDDIPGLKLYRPR
jgi:predicted nucleic acid-binding protein